jgi:hypothetical protein
VRATWNWGSCSETACHEMVVRLSNLLRVSRRASLRLASKLSRESNRFLQETVAQIVVQLQCFAWGLCCGVFQIESITTSDPVRRVHFKRDVSFLGYPGLTSFPRFIKAQSSADVDRGKSTGFVPAEI